MNDELNRRAPAQPEPAAPTEATLDQMAGKAWDRFQRHTAELQALENCRLYAARHRKEDWAATILRFCADGGATGSPLREAAPTVVEPDWGDIREQTEEATGLKVERNTYSIVIREVRKWLAATPPRAPTVVEPVAHCALTPAGKIAHFDGRPMVMIGSVGNEHHPTPLYAAAPPRAALTDEHPYTYASTQATNCAGCGEYKHTPLRIDAMDGYVCLTCIDKKLGTLLGEFGCPAPQSPLSEEDITSEYFASQLTTKDSVESVFAAGVRWAEKAHGIARAVIAADRGEK